MLDATDPATLGRLMRPDSEDPWIPRYVGSEVVIAAPGAGPGNWAGAPSAALSDAGVYLAYRVRRPEGEGRGVELVIAHSNDQVSFTQVGIVAKEVFGAESLERPALVRTDHGHWRLYVSCATPGTKHWRIELLEAAHPEGLVTAQPRLVLPGDSRTAVKDPVVNRTADGWEAWICVHPLDDPEATDRMWSIYAVSEDGLTWRTAGAALRPRAAHWDGRGTRITAVWRTDGGWVAFYDGRTNASENFEERTGIAGGASPAHLVPCGDAPVAASPHGGHGLRYVGILALPTGQRRVYYEAAREDGAHELRTELV